MKYKGIQRAISAQEIEDGYLDELINLRNENGILKPIGKKVKQYNKPSTDYDNLWKHNETEKIIGVLGGNLYDANLDLDTKELIKSLGSKILNIVFIKKFMIVTTENETHNFIYQNEAYKEVTTPPLPYVHLFTYNESSLSTDLEKSGKTLIGDYFKKLNKKNKNDGQLTGGAMYRLAYKMFDGTYMLHTTPEYISFGEEVKIGAIKYTNGDANYRIRFKTSNLKALFSKEKVADIDDKMFTHICIFMTKTEERYELTEEKITTEFLVDNLSSQTNGNIIIADAKDIFDSVSKDYANLVEHPYYLIHEQSISEIKEEAETSHDFGNYWTVTGVIKEIDLKGFYQDYATREALPIDQFSHHKLSGSVSYTYNSRLHLANTKSILGVYPQNVYQLTIPDFIHAVYLLTKINTDTGEKKILSPIKFLILTETNYIRLPIVLGYPDARATEIQVIVLKDGTYYKLETFKLKSYNNFAYHHNTATKEYGYTNVLVENILDTPVQIEENRITLDKNRLQVSELYNPFSFPTKLSYEVGTNDTITALATNTEAISTGQFGQHPLIIFTDKGRWIARQGSRDVVYANILPLDKEIVNPNSIKEVSGGVVFATKDGIYLSVGKNTTELTILLKGLPNKDFQANQHYKHYINDDNLVHMNTFLSTVDVRAYINDCKLIYDYYQKELIVTNPNYSYSYVYSFKTKLWHKISESFDVVINIHPQTLAISENGVFNISEEYNSDYNSCLLTTCPLKLSGNTFKTITRIIQRIQFETPENNYCGLYLFASNDLINWQRITGVQKTGKITDIRLQRSSQKAKYFIIVLAANFSADTVINSLDISYRDRINNKIR